MAQPKVPFEVVPDAETAQLAPVDPWKDARVLISSDELHHSIQQAESQGPSLAEQIDLIEREPGTEQDVRGLQWFSQWLGQRAVHTFPARVTFRELLMQEARRLEGKDPADKDRRFAALADILQGLSLSDAQEGKRARLGDALPDAFFLRKGSSGQTIRITTPLPQSLAGLSPRVELELLYGHRSLRGPNMQCGPCRPDPTSPGAYHRICETPDGEIVVLPCVPPPPPPPPTLSYHVTAGNSWWAIIFIVWHGSAYTRTYITKTGTTSTIPWIVPELEVGVDQPLGFTGWGPGVPCFGPCSSQYPCWPNASKRDSDYVERSSTQTCWGIGVMSIHRAAGRFAEFCRRKWEWI